MDEFQPLYTGSHALVIGIDTYGDPRFVPLGAAETDAQAVASVLAAPPYEFNVRRLLGRQATRAAILEELFKLRETNSNDRVMVYFAGHGYTLSNRFGAETGYLAAADTIPEQDFTALQLAEVTNLRLYAGAKHIGFIFDACFSGQVLGLTRSAAVAADKFLLRRAYQVISAGAGDQTVADFHSMTDVLVAALGGGVGGDSQSLTFSRLGLHLQESMAADSNQTQIPQFGHLQGSQGGEFVLEVDERGMISEGLSAALVSNSRHIRLGAVDALIEMAESGGPDQAQYAHQWLRRMAEEDSYPQVRAAAAAFFGSEPAPIRDAPPTSPVIAPPTPEVTPFREVDVQSAWARVQALLARAGRAVRAGLARYAPILIAIAGSITAWLVWWVLLTILNDAGVDDPYRIPDLVSGSLAGLTMALAIRRVAPQRLWHVLLLMLGWSLAMLIGDQIGRQLAGTIYDPVQTFLWDNLPDRVAYIIDTYRSNILGLPMTGLLAGLVTGGLLMIYYRGMRWSQVAILILTWIGALFIGGWLNSIVFDITSGIVDDLLPGIVAGTVIGALGGWVTLRQVRKAVGSPPS